MNDDPADELDIERAQPNRAARGLAHHGERLGQEIIECLAVGEPISEFVGLGAELIVGELLHLGLQPIDLIDDGLELAESLFVGLAEDPVDSAFEKFHSIVL
uniref:Uncharacterized protein n=1 Tax=uncultured Acetothermia bacterium TaxID=236499 RepID=H5SDL1_9BACT|nr:hypothetical protein HGMM_F13G06C30 [uncultured Acetothermia bacterium]